MPRPKRTKVAPSAPAPRIRQPAKSTPTVAAKAPASKLSPDNIYDVSDPDEGAILSARRVKKDNGKGKRKVPTGRGRDSTRARDDFAQRDLGAMEGGQDEELNEDELGGALYDDIDLDSSSIEVSRRDVNTPQMDTSRMSLANFKRRTRQPSILGRGPSRARSSSIESNLAEDNGLMSVRKRNTSAMGNVRGQQRQTSVSRNLPHVAPSSMALFMEKATPVRPASVLGNFKRRAREPSILGTGQKRTQARPDFDDDEEDFNPDDESTPLNFNQSRNMNTSPVLVAGSSSNPRKRKLSDIQVPRSSPDLPSPIPSRVEEAIPATMSDEEAEEEESDQDFDSEELELPMASIESRPITPEPLSETMAPPQSSSPASPTLPIAIRRPVPARGRPLRGRTPPPRTQDSPISSPPSLTHSPNRPITTGRQKPRKLVPPPSTFSTAQLQTLMPRRRRRVNRDPFDLPDSDDEVDASGLASDDDELSHLAARPRARRVPVPPVNKGKGKAVSKPSANRTYGSRATNLTSDKENENEEVDADDSLAPLPDDEEERVENSQELEQRVGLELKRAARKFAEVDQWELDFEDVTASSDSHRDAR